MEKRYGLVTDYSGNVVPGSTITVTNYPAGTIASLFRDNAGTPEDNPFVANAPDGRYTFYAADGRYRIDIAPPLDANLSASSVIDVILSDTAYLQRASKSEVAVLPLTQADAGKKVFITSSDGGSGTIRYDAGGVSDNGGAFCGTRFIINGDNTIYWERDYEDLLDPKWFGAQGDDTTDDRAAIALADAAGPIKFSFGTYKISSNITLINPVTFDADARLSIDTGIVVTFNQLITAPEVQIFTGLGTVAGLNACYVAWFTDKTNTATDALADIQKAYNACNNYANVYWPFGYLTIPGTTPISVAKGQKTVNRGLSTTTLQFSTTTCNGFSLNTLANAELSGMRFLCTAGRPTAGTTIKSTISTAKISQFLIEQCFVGVEFGSGAVANIIDRFTIRDAQFIGVFCNEVNDIIIDKFFITAITEYFDVSGLAGGPFVVGETVTGGTSGATGTVAVVNSDTELKVSVQNINFTAGETLTGGTSGATATLVTQHIPHEAGGIRLFDKVEALMVSKGDIIGGNYSLITGATSYTLGNRPAYCRFTNVYFDSSDQGIQLDNCVSLRFTDCWFSNRPGSGGRALVTEDIEFNGGGFINCWQHGFQVLATAVRTRFNGVTVSGNNQAGTTFDGLRFETGASDFIVQGCTAGGTLGFGTQRYGIIVATGASDRYIIADNLVSGNGTGGVLDNGTGTNKRVANNY